MKSHSLFQFVLTSSLLRTTPAARLAFQAPNRVSADAGAPVAKDFGSFSFEFAFFLDYVGNQSNPNTFTSTLLQNLGNLTGAMPIIRVGGTSQDRALFDPNLTIPINNTFADPPGDQPIAVTIGPSFFSSFEALPAGTTLIPGLNFGANGSSGRTSLLGETDGTCRALSPQTLHLWEVGNEDDIASFQSYRPANFTVNDYVSEWVDRSRAIVAQVESSCPDLADDIGFFAPSFALNPVDPDGFGADTAFSLGLNQDGWIKEISMHNYMNSISTNRTLAGLLLNHTSIVEVVAGHLDLAQRLEYLGIPYILGETNSVSGQGVNGITNVFGSALWLVDYNLWIASQGIGRVHMHQGLNYRYASWQPITSNGIPPTTRPPYYGNIMVAKTIGRTSNSTQIVNIPLSSEKQTAYGVYDAGSLTRIVVINMDEFNTTSSTPRSTAEFTIQLSDSTSDEVSARVERLTAAGSDVTDGITFGGVSYDFELDGGRPVVVNDTEEVVTTSGGQMSVEVAAAEAVLLSFN